ncbi:spore germination protein [Bacillaceae bacterium Marseille-Q3522]|nr:spore germination protein [Bacillaceae bacterium Marseille-Q3522]
MIFELNEQTKVTQNEGSSASKPVLNARLLRKIFAKCPDVHFSVFTFQNQHVTLIYCSGLVNQETLFKTIPKALESFFSSHNDEHNKETIINGLNLPNLGYIEQKEKAESEIFAGKLLIDFGLPGTIIYVDIADRPKRNPEDANTEANIQGARDNFIEELYVNISLIRKRLRTASFVYEVLEIGRRTKTKVAILYLEDIANKDILKKIKDKLDQIDIDGLFSGTQLEELINDRPYALFPRHRYTGKPDFAVTSVLNGRFIILIDGVTTAYITPVNFSFILKVAEDQEVSYIVSSLQRIMRVGGLFISTFLPGFWVAITTIHQDQLPINLLATVVESRRGVPLPTSFEAFIMLIIFGLFNEAGLRLPKSIGQILSVVGGLIIGEAAISAGLTSPAMLVIISLSTVATFTLQNTSLIGTLFFARFFVLLCSSLLGFFGLLFSFFLLCGYIGNIQIFGVPYLEMANDLSAGNFLKTFFRVPEQKWKKRPSSVQVNDQSKKGN